MSKILLSSIIFLAGCAPYVICKDGKLYKQAVPFSSPFETTPYVESANGAKCYSSEDLK